MRNEVLRMDRVTYQEQGITELNHFCLNLYAGEIMGLVTVNDTGLEALLRLMKQNVPIHYGYVYYRGRLVNQWRQSNESYNRIGVIQTQSGLADDLTVADNVFVMRHGFRKRIIQRDVLERQLEPFLREIDVHISGDLTAGNLSPYHRVIVEIVKAVVADCRLIVLIEPCTVIGEERLGRLHQIMRHYAEQGFSFLYVSQHFEETAQICDRVSLMLNGQIAKVLSPSEATRSLASCFGNEKYNELAHTRNRPKRDAQSDTPALELRQLRYGAINDLDLRVMPGECVVVQDMNNHIFKDLITVLSGEKKPESGQALVDGLPLNRRGSRRVAVVDKLTTESMLFPHLSYMDNLCFTMDHLLPTIWRKRRARRSIRQEWSSVLGERVFDLPVESLSRKQKAELIYTRVMLQRPKALVCVQPFMHADMEHRMHVWTLLERLLDQGVAVVILAVNMADSLLFADRLLRVRDGHVLVTYSREEFGCLPENTPWHDLWVQPTETSD